MPYIAVGLQHSLKEFTLFIMFHSLLCTAIVTTGHIVWPTMDVIKDLISYRQGAFFG